MKLRKTVALISVSCALGLTSGTSVAQYRDVLKGFSVVYMATGVQYSAGAGGARTTVSCVSMNEKATTYSEATVGIRIEYYDEFGNPTTGTTGVDHTLGSQIAAPLGTLTVPAGSGDMGTTPISGGSVRVIASKAIASGVICTGQVFGADSDSHALTMVRVKAPKFAPAKETY